MSLENQEHEGELSWQTKFVKKITIVIIIIIIIITELLNLRTAITVIDHFIIFYIISPFKYWVSNVVVVV